MIDGWDLPSKTHKNQHRGERERESRSPHHVNYQNDNSNPHLTATQPHLQENQPRPASRLALHAASAMHVETHDTVLYAVGMSCCRRHGRAPGGERTVVFVRIEDQGGCSTLLRCPHCWYPTRPLRWKCCSGQVPCLRNPPRPRQHGMRPCAWTCCQCGTTA